MEASVKEAEGFEFVCPDCVCCFRDDPERCPECDRRRPEAGWNRTASTPYAYLGRVVQERYRLEQFLGGGGAGTVYRARDLELDRPVALKILDVPGSPDEERIERVRRRFRHEVEALSRIRNPHVINIHESLMLEGGVPGMLTEYIEGRTLGETLEASEEIELKAALVLVHQIANGLHEAHLRGVIHRDIKPDNVIVEQLPASGWFARLLDFGLVHLVDTQRQTRGFHGTPLYAAPEQCRSSTEITRSVDIYSLGCLLFHLVAGRPPFVHSDARALIFAHVDEPAPRLSEVTDRRIPERLEDLVASMLEKDPEERPDDLSHVVAEFEALIQQLEGTRSSNFGVETHDGLGTTTSSLRREASYGLNRGDSIAESFAEEDDGGPDTRRLAQLVQFVDLEELDGRFDGPVVATSVDGEGDCAAVSDSAGGVYAMSLRGNRFCESYSPAGARVMALTAGSRIGALFGVTEKGEILEWELARPEAPPESIAEVSRYVFGLDTDSRGEKLYWVSDAGDLWRRDRRLARGDVVCELPPATTHLQVADDGSRAVTAGSDGSVRVTSLGEGGAETSVVTELESGVNALYYKQTSGVVLVACENGSLHGGRADDEQLQLLDSSVTTVRALGVTGDVQMVGLGVRGSTVQTWRLRYEKFERRLGWFESQETTNSDRIPPDLLSEDDE